MAKINIQHFSDVLCVWAYFSEPRIAEMRKNFGQDLEIEFRFVAVFGDVPGKMQTAWKDKGGYEGFAQHLAHAAKQFPEIHLNENLWRSVRPFSSLAPHLFLRAIDLCEKNGACPAGSFASAISAMREAFFLHGHDIARLDVQTALAKSLKLPMSEITAHLESGAAHATLSADYKLAETLDVRGSPTLVLNQGRQKLYGNVGYKIIEANIQELLRSPRPEDASWC